MVHITTGIISILMVFILVMQGNVSKSIPEGALDKINQTDTECHTDTDCYGLDQNTYCDTSINLCSQCVNCSLYFRKPNLSIECPKDIDNCGSCLDGYFEEVFFGGEVREFCITKVEPSLPSPEKISSSFNWSNISIISIIVMFLSSLLWIYFYKGNHSVNHNVPSNFQNGTTPPPSYDSCMKLDNYVTDDVQEFHLFTGEQPPRNEWRHQNAVPFRLVDDNITEMNVRVDENENTEEVDGIDGSIIREIEAPELHDEETMPSVWSPPLPELVETEQSNLEASSPPSKRIKLIQQQSV
ncbi:uncharacterized protein LOC126833916 isoform X2 [Adelges cooleyi]|nr:uncharacterized protein LOC126833916 isoform X2 [Adelges cooleyi]